MESRREYTSPTRQFGRDIRDMSDLDGRMPIVLAEMLDGPRAHASYIEHLLRSTSGRLRVTSPYVTDTEILQHAANRNTQLITTLSTMDIVSGATNLDALAGMLDAGVSISIAPRFPKLHAKVYLFGEGNAIVSSANLTTSGLHRNLEAGVALSGRAVSKLTAWYEEMLRRSRPLQVSDIVCARRQSRIFRSAYEDLKRKARARIVLPRAGQGEITSNSRITKLFQTATQFFACNTDRRNPAHTTLGAPLHEDLMHRRGYAAAWENFDFPGHMEAVQPGAVILMFANRVGVIGIGCAKAEVERLNPRTPGRLRKSNAIEWRIPVTWLDWRDEASAYRCKAFRHTFLNITADKHEPLRNSVLAHFCSDEL